MFLFIFESIGTSELILIGAVALIVFGPRKLPQLAKTLGKTIADFKNTTNEFKTTWEREVNFEEETSISDTAILPAKNQKSKLSGTVAKVENAEIVPEIKEIDASQFNLGQETKNQIEQVKKESSVQPVANKQNWL